MIMTKCPRCFRRLPDGEWVFACRSGRCQEYEDPVGSAHTGIGVRIGPMHSVRRNPEVKHWRLPDDAHLCHQRRDSELAYSDPRDPSARDRCQPGCYSDNPPGDRNLADGATFLYPHHGDHDHHNAEDAESDPETTIRGPVEEEQVGDAIPAGDEHEGSHQRTDSEERDRQPIRPPPPDPVDQVPE